MAKNSMDLTIRDAYSSKTFEEAYTYTGDDLGANWTKDFTVFKVWAPTAKNVSVHLYKSGDRSNQDLIDTVGMTEENCGVWSAVVYGNQQGIYYTYAADFGTYAKETCDPYARAVGVNGDRAMVIDLRETDPDGWDQDGNPNSGLKPTEAVIYEVHIRDMSADASSGINHAGKYLGLIEKGTKNSYGQPTGLDHMLKLGVTHVQLEPVFDYATVDETKPEKNQYNWGYDPKNYNVPEGSYATDPYDGAVRIAEFKKMVLGLHEAGLSVVMDVVYNHTYDTDFCMNVLVPGYFHRSGANGSGCGNDVASERSMVSKFIVDSVVYWAKEYHIDGFRFDLAGLLDTGTMQVLREALNEIDPSILTYGEGWDLKTKMTKKDVPLAMQRNISKISDFAMFNDSIRDTLKGSVFEPTKKGFVNGGSVKETAVYDLVRGVTSWSKKPYQLVNYVSCHDNMTLWDALNSSGAEDSYENRIKQNLLAAAIIYTAQGIPFMLSGEEMLRTKTNADGTLNENSYNAPDSVNSIKWNTLNDETYRMVLEYYKGLIAFRKAHAALTMMDTAAAYYTLSGETKKGVVAYELAPCNGETSDGLFIVYNSLHENRRIALPKGKWTIYVRGTTAGTKVLGTAEGAVTVEPVSCVVLTK